MQPQRKPRFFGVSLLILFGLIAVACGGGTDTATEPLSTSDAIAAGDAPAAEAAPDQGIYSGEFVDLTGTTIDFASFEGQDTVLWFWAPW